MELDKKIIGNRIKKERNNLGITQEELAIKLGLNNKSSISQYESGNAIPSDDIKLLMSNLFDCTIDYLLGKSDIRNFDKNIQGMEKTSGVPAVVFVYGTIPAGVQIEMIEDIIDTEEVPIEMTKGDKQLFRTSYKR